METKTSTEIQLVQKPVIRHQLAVIGASVTERIAKLDIDNLVPSEDSVKALKELRAELNKELKEYEEQRTFVKKSISAPYLEFEEIYKAEISEKYTSAVDKLKDKIAIVETKIKDEKKAKVVAYFNELCTAEQINFLKWESLGIDINLSTSLKNYTEQVNKFVLKTKDDLALIATNEYQAEILVEYHKTLNVAQSITSVQDRKKQEEMEKARLYREEIAKREATIIGLGMKRSELAKVYEYNDSIMITDVELHKLDSKQWMEMLADIEFQIKQVKAEEQKKQRDLEMVLGRAAVKAPFYEPVPAPISKPVVVPTSTPVTTEERLVTASFKVTGTLKALKDLGQYMKDNNIKYENL